MARVAQRSIEAIKNQVDLVEVVSPYAQLKRAGRSWKGLSPFTQEKTPSFYVLPDRGFYKCFSTGEGGDCFSFIMKMENLEFIEAVEFVAKKFNIALEYEEGGPSREEISLRKRIFELHEWTSSWFHRHFMESEEAAPVRAYWQEERGFDLETAKEYKIGYAPASINGLAQVCEKKGVPLNVMQASGLFFSRDNETDYRRYKSRFRGRLMVPIRDVQSRVVAFTARQLPQTPQDDPAREAKYVNSPETQIFHKGRILFGLDHARTHLKENDSFLMVEGQLDAIRCWTAGLHTTVAPQGTAITEEQLALLRRYDPASVDCLLDGDSAGRKAAIRALPLVFKAGLEFRFLLLPEKADPDDLIRNGGAEAIHPLRESALSAIELSISESVPKDRAPTTHEKMAAMRSVFELIRHVESEVAREDYIQSASNLLRIDPQAAMVDFKRNARSRPQKRQAPDTEPLPAEPKDTLLTQATWEILWLLLNHPERADLVSQNTDYEWINTETTAGSLLSRILAEHSEGLLENVNEIENLIESPEERGLLADIHSRDLEIEEPEKQIEQCLEKLFRNHTESRVKDLEQRIINADPNDQLQLMRERKQLHTALKQPFRLQR